MNLLTLVVSMEMHIVMGFIVKIVQIYRMCQSDAKYVFIVINE